MKIVVLVNGAAESGKDTFIKYVQECAKNKNFLVFNESSIDPVKNAMRAYLGWDGERKEEVDRALMADIKAAWDKYYNDTVDFCLGQINQKFFNSQGTVLLFLHVREPRNLSNILQAFKVNFSAIPNYYITTLLVRATGRNIKKYNNPADKGVGAFNYAVIVENDGTEKELRTKAIGFCSLLSQGSFLQPNEKED